MDALTEKEAQVLGHIAQHASISQRGLAKTAGISLGLVNIILQRFIKTGYIHIAKLDKRRVEYVLTPVGFLQTVRRTYSYATRTIQSYQALQTSLTALIHQLIQLGYRYFSIHGDGELYGLIASIVTEQTSAYGTVLGLDHRGDAAAVVLNVTPEVVASPNGGAVVNVLEKIGWIQ
ncbi:MAG: winged helix-turn-helix transcriptional regulator [Deltaproteobacteria bacterium]|nr:winged helix-turn-helix transcriptional regulator [Deltaproteobacteria bacterium]